MPRFGRYGLCSMTPHLRKSLRGLLRKRRQAGSVPAVKRGLENADENAVPSGSVSEASFAQHSCRCLPWPIRELIYANRKTLFAAVSAKSDQVQFRPRYYRSAFAPPLSMSTPVSTRSFLASAASISV